MSLPALQRSAATIHTMTPARVPYRADDVHRCPDELLASDLPDWAVRVWLAVRKYQGSNTEAWAKAEAYAETAGKSVSQTRNALSLLRKAGWLEEVGKEGNTPRLRCHVPGVTVPRSVTTSDALTVAEGPEASPPVTQASPPVTPSVTTSDVPYIRIESGQEPYQESVSQQQQQQGSGLNDPGGAERKRERYPYNEKGAKLLVGNGVFPAVAAKLVTQHPPRRVLKELARLRATQQLGPVKDPGGLLVRWIRGAEEPLPGWDETAVAEGPR